MLAWTCSWTVLTLLMLVGCPVPGPTSNPRWMLGSMPARQAMRVGPTQVSTLAVMAFATGLTGFSLVKVLAPGYFARQDTRTPMKIGVRSLVVNMALNVFVVLPLALWGNRPGLHALLARLGATANWRRIAEELWPWVGGPPSTPLGELEAVGRVDERLKTRLGALLARLETERATRLVAGRYHKRQRLGEGSFAEVWLAHDFTLNCSVALKLFKTRDRLAQDRILEEATLFRKESRCLWACPTTSSGRLRTI